MAMLFRSQHGAAALLLLDMKAGEGIEPLNMRILTPLLYPSELSSSRRDCRKARGR